MVVRDKSGEYDPFDSINELMDNLELDARRTNQLINQPWKAYYEERKASPIEMPRASSSNSQPQLRRTTPSDNQYLQISPSQSQQITPPQNQYHRVTSPENLFVPVSNRATGVQSQPFRSVTSRPVQRGTISSYELPKLKPFYSEPIMSGDRRKSKKTHTKLEDLATVCGMLRHFREYTYKGSLRETQYRLQQVEEAQRMSSRMPISRMSCF